MEVAMHTKLRFHVYTRYDMQQLYQSEAPTPPGRLNTQCHNAGYCVLGSEFKLWAQGSAHSDLYSTEEY